MLPTEFMKANTNLLKKGLFCIKINMHVKEHPVIILFDETWKIRCILSYLPAKHKHAIFTSEPFTYLSWQQWEIYRRLHSLK